jgi:cytochrome c oxidase subunit 1
MSYLIAVPTGIKFFNWIGTMWRGSVILNAPMLFSIGFLLLFLGGGVTGIFLASPPIDFATHDTYFVVAHFHQVIFALVFGAFSGIYYWYPKAFGRMLRDGIGRVSFWLMIVGSFVMLTPMYLVGLRGMPRRIAEYAATTGWTDLNRVASLGSYMIFIGVALTCYNLVISWRKPIPCGANPWDANSLEWATSSPPPHHNFDSIPPIRSERPVWDANHPDLTTRGHGATSPTRVESEVSV